MLSLKEGICPGNYKKVLKAQAAAIKKEINIAELGGDSLSALRILSAVEADEMHGYIVLRIDDRKDATTEYIVDVFSREDATIIMRLVRTFKTFRERNVNFALCSMIKGDMMGRRRKAVGFMRNKDIKSLQASCVITNNAGDQRHITDSLHGYLSCREVDEF